MIDDLPARDFAGGMPVIGEIEKRLRAAWEPVLLDIRDDSSLHAGHGGSRPGGETHFHVRVVAEAFEGKSRVERHRMIHAALGDLLTARVHALGIDARAPSES